MHTSIHLADFASDAAGYILEFGQKAIAGSGLFRLGLAGGETPRAIYSRLVEIGGDFPWEKTLITFGDERCVPPDHADSNYLMARESLLEPARIPAGNIFRMRGEIDPAAAAEEYE